MLETNSLILDGTHVRVFASELEPGDIDAFGETVGHVEWSSQQDYVWVHYIGGASNLYRADSTILVRVDE